MGYLIDILIGAVSGIVTGELSAHVEPMARWIIGKAAERLPADVRARFREEWVAHLNETPSAVRKLWHAVGCHHAAGKIAYVLARQTKPRTVSEEGTALIKVSQSDVAALLRLIRYMSTEARRLSLKTGRRKISKSDRAALLKVGTLRP